MYPEVTFCSHGDSVSDETLIYSFGTSIKYHTSIKSQGATRCVTSDPGAQLDRDPKATFTSRVFDTGLTNPTYLVLAWKASTPLRTALNIQLRSGADPASLTSAHWYGPFDQGGIYNASQLSTQADVNQVHNGQRYIQYRAVLRHDFTNTPVLDRLQISFKPGKVK